MSQGTVMPSPYQTVFDSNGDPISGALIWTYIAGLSTAQDTFTTSALNIANTNPIVADSAGRFVAFLTPGASYKFVFETAATPPAHGTVIRTCDNILAVPTAAGNTEVPGIAGEALTSGQAVYLSDGSASKTVGQWYIADAGNPYSSTIPEVGMITASVAQGASGTIRQAGQMTGLAGLSVGLNYYIGTAGAITATAPANARFLGGADSTSTLVLSANPSVPPMDTRIDDFRLTLTTGVPVTTSDVTAATTLYCSPYRGNRLVLFNAAGVPSLYTSAQFSIAVPATTNTNYDIFAFASSGTPALELTAFRNSGQAITGATNATPIVITANTHGLSNGDEVYVSGVKGNTAANGTWTVANSAANTFELATSIGNGGYTAATGFFNARTSTGKLTLATTGTYTKTADLTRRYLGTFRTTGSSGQTEDSAAKRYLYNYYNEVARPLLQLDATASWAYTLATWRQAHATATNQVEIVQGIAERPVLIELRATASNDTGGLNASVGIGENSTTVPVSATAVADAIIITALAGQQLSVALRKVPSVGWNSYVWLEASQAVGATTWWGAPNTTAGSSGATGSCLQGMCEA